MAAVANRGQASAKRSKRRYLNPGQNFLHVVIIDELADLIQTVAADVDSAILQRALVVSQFLTSSNRHFIRSPAFSTENCSAIPFFARSARTDRKSTRLNSSH